MTPLLLVLVFLGCAARPTLQTDYGRASLAAWSTQADLSRSIPSEPLGGLEAQAIRLQAQRAASDLETARPALIGIAP